MLPFLSYAYAAAFWQAVGSGNRVVLGHDLRPSSPGIAASCAAAFRDLGVEVEYVGSLATPAVAHYAIEAGVPAVIVTGSHIPFDRNGIKFYSADGEITKANEQSILQASVEVPAEFAAPPLPLPSSEAHNAYISRYVQFFGSRALEGKRIAIYEHSSVARDLLRIVLQRLGAEVLSLGRTDTFVPIDTEAVRAEDVAQAAQWATENSFDAIVSTDGDADRPLIGDEEGQWFRGDVVGVLCAKYLNADVVATPVSSNTAVEKAGWFKQVVRTRIGSPYVISAMDAASRAGSGNVVVGYEANGGFLLGSDVRLNGKYLSALPTRDAMLPIIALLSMAKQRQCKVSEIALNLPQRFTHSDRLQSFSSEASVALLAQLSKDIDSAADILAPDAGRVASLDETDGMRVTFSTGEIVHLRRSGNAPELRCYVEGDSQLRAKYLCDACLARILNLKEQLPPI